MVVVVQLFAANEDAPWRNIGAGVWRLKVAVAPIVRSTIDDAGRCDGNPHHLHRPNGQAQGTEQSQVDDEHQRHAQHRVRGVDVALYPVVGRAVTKTLERVEIFGFFAVQLSTREQHGFDTVHMRAVWVVRLLALGVVLAVNGGPLFGHLGRGEPQPETEKVRHDRMQIQSAVCRVAVQVDGHAGDGDVCEHHRDDEDLPARKMQQAVAQPVQRGVKPSPIG